MPNWCDNTLYMTHKDPKMVDKAIEGWKNNKFFGTLVPEPDYTQVKVKPTFPMNMATGEAKTEFVHHDRKLAAKDVFETISGSNGLFGAADTALVVTGDRNSSERVLHVTGRDITERQITMKFEDGIWEFVSDGKRNLISPERKIIMDALMEFGPMTPTKLAEKLNKKRAGVNRLLLALKDKGILVQNENDEYMLKEDDAVIPEAPDAEAETLAV